MCHPSHVRPAFLAGTAPCISAHGITESYRGHQCGRDLHHHSGHPLCHRYGTCADFPVQSPHPNHEPADPARLAQQRRAAKGTVRAGPAWPLHPSLRRRGLRKTSLVYRTGDSESQSRRGHSEDAFPSSRRYLRFPLHRSARSAGHPGRHRSPPGTGGCRKNRKERRRSRCRIISVD